ncbi:MAG: AraC family transcriptional regulator [Kiritimatiellae bacterium]|nr:AraC family transcriptional regulator [Kiritimatiellia bacterium]
MPGISFVVKNAEGRILWTNAYNAAISGWRSMDEMVGYTSWELYPPEQAEVYGGRDREVMESGVPIVNRNYGFVADRSPNLNCVTVRPVVALDGTRIGTVTLYHRAEKRLRMKNWYEPIKRAVLWLNDHYAENVTVEKLAALSHFSPTQFRTLFARLTQMTPAAYILQVRVNAAKGLLTTTDMRIADIASAVGFYDQSHFIRTFQKLTGQTPARFRRSI